MRLKKLNYIGLIGLLLLVGLVACGEEIRPTTTTSPAPASQLVVTTVVVPATTAVVLSANPTGTATTLPPKSSSVSAVTTTASVGSGGMTMKTAWSAVEGPVKGWHTDAVYISVFNPPDTTIGMDSEGRASQWFFEVLSPGTLKRSNWLVKSEADGKNPVVSKSSEDELSKDRAQLLEGRKLPPVVGLIDTKQLLEVARQNGGTKSDQPLGTRLARSAKEGDALAFDLLFYKGDDVLRLRIDAQSGKLLDNARG